MKYRQFNSFQAFHLFVNSLSIFFIKRKNIFIIILNFVFHFFLSKDIISFQVHICYSLSYVIYYSSYNLWRSIRNENYRQYKQMIMLIGNLEKVSDSNTFRSIHFNRSDRINKLLSERQSNSAALFVSFVCRCKHEASTVLFYATKYERISFCKWYYC